MRSHVNNSKKVSCCHDTVSIRNCTGLKHVIQLCSLLHGAHAVVSRKQTTASKHFCSNHGQSFACLRSHAHMCVLQARGVEQRARRCSGSCVSACCVASPEDSSLSTLLELSFLSERRAPSCCCSILLPSTLFKPQVPSVQEQQNAQIASQRGHAASRSSDALDKGNRLFGGTCLNAAGRIWPHRRKWA